MYILAYKKGYESITISIFIYYHFNLKLMKMLLSLTMLVLASSLINYIYAQQENSCNMTDVPKNMTVILNKDLQDTKNVTVTYEDEDGTQVHFPCFCKKWTCPCELGDLP
jgi:hypothetical protein